MARKKVIKGLKELEAAERRPPVSKFVKSCRAFLTKSGFLSDKQIEALTFAGTPNRRERQFGYYREDPDSDYEFIDLDLLNIDDFN